MYIFFLQQFLNKKKYFYVANFFFTVYVLLKDDEFKIVKNM